MKGDKILVMATKSESGSVLGSLSNSVFARRTSTGSGVVSFKTYNLRRGPHFPPDDVRRSNGSARDGPLEVKRGWGRQDSTALLVNFCWFAMCACFLFVWFSPVLVGIFPACSGCLHFFT